MDAYKVLIPNTLKYEIIREETLISNPSSVPPQSLQPACPPFTSPTGQPGKAGWLPRVHLCSYCRYNSGQEDSLLSNKINVTPQLCSPPLAILNQFKLDHKPLFTSKIFSPNEKKKRPLQLVFTSGITQCDLKLSVPSDEEKKRKDQVCGRLRLRLQVGRTRRSRTSVC